MKPLQDVLKAVGTFGIKPDARLLAVAAIALPVVGAIGGVLLARYSAKKKAEKKEGEKAQTAVLPAGAPTPGGSAPAPGQLRKAWLRFLGRIPPLYRRSILNFEQFVVLGDASSGKSKVVDTYTDWQRQAKGFGAPQEADPELPIYLSSSAVVMEIPAKILEDNGDATRKALTRLWRPLFTQRAPTVIAVVDAIRLRDSTTDVIRELAEAIRVKVNLLASIRGRPIEIRVVLTHLDGVEGYTEFAAFCREKGISMRTRLAAEPGHPADLRLRIDAWYEEARGHLPLALTSLASTDYRRVVAFLARVPELFPSLQRLLDALFAHEALSPDPVRGALYFFSDPPGEPNPLAAALEGGPGPDPRIRHAIIAAAIAGGALAYQGLAFSEQHALWSEASQALERYNPTVANVELEEELRETISEFTYRNQRWIMRHPNFFSGPRKTVRNEFSTRVRDELLIPKLREVAEKGTAYKGQAPLPFRRSLYYLALIHSDRHDGMGIIADGAGRDRREIWAKMTGLSPQLIEDYLKNTYAAYRSPLSFELSAQRIDPRDTSLMWRSLFRVIQETVRDGVLTPAELASLQEQAEKLRAALARFDHDNVTQRILDDIDHAAGIGRESEDDRGGQTSLRLAYEPRYREFLKSIESFNDLSREDLRSVLETVRGSSITAPQERLLRGVLDQLSVLYDSPLSADSTARRIKLDDDELVFDELRWAELLRDSKASLLISTFVSTNEGSIFFGPQGDPELRSVTWNPYGDDATIFVGRGVLEARYTRAAYDKHVKGTVTKLAAVLAKTKISDELKRTLQDFVRDHVRRYAVEYRRQMVSFVQSFDLRTPSSEALRVALSQMASDSSPFNDFVVAVDYHSTLDTSDPLLLPMQEAMAEFDAWHKAMGGADGAAELGKYKAIIGQLLADLGPPQAGAAPGAPPEPEATNGQGGTLEKELSAAGRLVLANLRNEKGSYALLVNAWVAGVKLPGYQQGAFTAPLRRLSEIGRRDIESVIGRVWRQEMLTGIQGVVDGFPFSQDSKEDVTPTELSGLLHPVEGRFFDLFRRYLEPVSQFGDGGAFRVLPSVRGNLTFPEHMYSIINAAAGLSARLWDANGTPLPIETRITTVPFDRVVTNQLSTVTLIFLNVGDASVFNFDQKPGIATMRLEWTKQHNAQVGLQVTNIDTKENSFPPPIAAEGSFWAFHRLLQKAQVSPVKQPPTARLYTWEVPASKDGPEKTRARFVVMEDPWELFSLGRQPGVRVGR